MTLFYSNYLVKGNVYFERKKVHFGEVVKHFDWKSIVLQSKEGLTLLNGMQFMTAYDVHILIKVSKFSCLADLILIISLEDFDGRFKPYNELIHCIRLYKEQIVTANRIKRFLDRSQIIEHHKNHVQDPYLFRSMPQVYGTSEGAMDDVKKVFKIKINSVTNNRNIFTKSDQIISGGNLHGQQLALAELGSISKRKTYQLISGNRSISAFLVHNSGLNSGVMIPQYAAASIASQNKQLVIPAGVACFKSSKG